MLFARTPSMNLRMTWIFGYGSLIWRPDFPFVDRQVADLRGYARRFWQGSTDHRGVPGAPGRVVTLVPEPNHSCRGIAFKLAPEQESQVLSKLDHRERGGYDRLTKTLVTPNGETFSAIIYLATPSNPNWLGPASISDISKQVVKSRSLSGDNTTYVLELDKALLEIEAHDDHVHQIASAVLELL